MTATCTECGGAFDRQRSPRCLPCRTRERLAYQRSYEAAKRARERAALAHQPAIIQEAHREAGLSSWRARYRRRNPPPLCTGCQKPTARRNQATCDACCTDLEARIVKRERARLAREARLAGLAHRCKDCGGKVLEPRFRRCAPCRVKASKINYWQAYRAAETLEERADRLAFGRAKYRALHPLEPCPDCGRPKQHNNQRECNDCCPPDDVLRERQRSIRRRRRAAARAAGKEES